MMNNFIRNIDRKNHVEARKTFKATLAGKLLEKLATRKLEVAKSLGEKNET